MATKFKSNLREVEDLDERHYAILELASASQFYMEYPDDNHTMFFLNEILRILDPEAHKRLVEQHPCWHLGEEVEIAFDEF